MTVQLETPESVETPLENSVEQVVDPTELLQNEWTGGVMTGTIRNMIGTPPPGFEFVEYAVGGAIFIILFALIATVFVGFSKMLGAR